MMGQSQAQVAQVAQVAQAESKGKNNFKVTFDFVKTPITQIADYIIISASKNNASDIHFDPREDGMMVRFRIDGDLQDYSYIPKAYERNLSTRLKLLANMNITESRLPQDGAIKGVFGDKYLDMRVSCLPLNEGEKIVIRILDYSRSLQGIETLGFHPDNLVKLKRMMEAPNGIILVTGATGSGKSTTTYSILQGLNKPETNIITVEDPIEMNIQGINQVQVNSEIGMTFAAALRSILRQDPNIILIGEIRDSETAQIAVRSAITGHLVLSTIHTNNSLSTIERLLDMDVERYLLSTALNGIISQRLAKAICPYCKFQRKTTPYERKVFKNFMKLSVGTIWDANPSGCEHCRKGYRGRIAIQEVLELDDDIRNALNTEHLTKEELREMVYTNKTITMLQDALIKCLNGNTSFEEVYRVIEMENDEGEDYHSELTAAMHEVSDDFEDDLGFSSTSSGNDHVTVIVDQLPDSVFTEDEMNAMKGIDTSVETTPITEEVEEADSQDQTETEEESNTKEEEEEIEEQETKEEVPEETPQEEITSDEEKNTEEETPEETETTTDTENEETNEEDTSPTDQLPNVVDNLQQIVVNPNDLTIGSDQVDMDMPILEEIPRLGTEIEIQNEKQSNITDEIIQDSQEEFSNIAEDNTNIDTQEETPETNQESTNDNYIDIVENTIPDHSEEVTNQEDTNEIVIPKFTEE